MSSWVVTHDFAYTLGGAERVSALLVTDVVPGATLMPFAGEPDVFTDLGVPAPDFHRQRWFTERNYRQVSLVLPLLCRRTRPLDEPVIASSYAFAHHVRTTASKIVYCHSPLRQIWSGREMYLDSMPTIVRPPAGAALRSLRRADLAAAASATCYVANSHAVADRVTRYYGIDPVAVIHPPHDPRFAPGPTERGEHYLWAGRIVEPYKRLTVLVDAFRELDRELWVVGDGRDAARIRAGSPANVRFLGPMATDDLVLEYQRARAVLFPSEDDFGIVPIEAMACGAPVIAFGRGGALETVVDGETGVLFDEQHPVAVREAIARFEASAFDGSRIIDHAEGFSEQAFVRAMRAVVASVAT